MASGFGSSLKTRITAVAGLLFLAGIGIIALFVTRILHDDMQVMLSQQQLTAASFVARDVDSKLTLRLDSLKRVASNIPPAMFAEPAMLQRWLEDRRAINTLFPTGLLVIPPDGGPALAETPRLETRPKSFTDRDWFVNAVKTGAPVFSRPLITRATGQPALVIAIPIFDAQQRLQGVLAGITPLTTPGFLQLILGARPGKHGSYQLISPKHGLFALATDIGSAIKPLPEAGRDPVIDRALGGLRGTQVIRNAEGEDEFAAFVEIPSAGWLLIARQPANEAFAPVQNTIRNTLLIAVLLSIPIIAILLAALRHQLQPMAQLAEDIREMADGTRPLLPVAKHGASEVTQVADSFNRLQGKLLEQEARLARMAHHDTLTGLPNRRMVNERLDHELRQIARTGQGLALLFLDLDGFKPVNDQYGHQIGDLLLIEIAKRLQACVREADTVSRLGGDEFLILLSHTDAPQEAAERVASQCIDRLSRPIRIGEQAITVGVSIGIAACSGEEAETQTAKQLICDADTAMYAAKTNGRNRYVVHSQPSPTSET